MYHYFFRPILNAIFATVGIIFAINLIMLLSLRRKIRSSWRLYINRCFIIKLQEIQKLIVMLIRESVEEKEVELYTDAELLSMYWDMEYSVIELKKIHKLISIEC